MQELVRKAINESGFSRSELARRAGLSASTITRIGKGEVDPTLGTAERILAAAGLQLIPAVQPLCDTAMLRAARAILGESGAPEAGDTRASTLMRWASPDGSPRPRALAREAAAAAAPASRPGLVEASTDWNFLRLCSTVAATREPWAVSGAPAAEHIGAAAAAGPVIFYVPNPRRTATLLEPAGRRAQKVLLLPFDGSEDGAWSAEGIVWADPIQVILDCYGMTETVQSADELTADWKDAR